ncbi:hypothetical protein [Novosphingobium sp.]|uniref:hypothetical protein n=1 Tax=Novosphingobium sp. TaxID=1874826 RepID=UPI00260B5CAC|nr:hypothetical protein [Novosphingobium sp.]
MAGDLKWQRGGAGVALVALALSAQAHAQQAEEQATDSLRVSVGATYADGRYGQTARTEIVTVPVSVKYTRSRFSVKVTTAYVHLRGPGTLLDGTGSGASGSGGSSGSGSGVASEPEIETEPGDDSSGGGNGSGGGTGSGSGEGEGEGGGTGSGTGTGTGTGTGGPVVPLSRRNRGGLGDTTVTLAYSLPLGDHFTFEPRSRVKLPTASSRKGIGTGKVDVTLAADLVGTFGGTTLYASARRRFLGRTARFPVHDGWGFGAGASHALGPVLTLGADYDWLQSATPGRGPISEGTVWVSARLSRQLRLQAYGGTGFSSRSADTIGGLTLVWRP